MGRVENKVSMVTGGALGIGRNTCLTLAKEGSKVAVDENRLISFVEDKITQCVEAYIRLQVNPSYHKHIMSMDPVCHKVVNTFFQRLTRYFKIKNTIPAPQPAVINSWITPNDI